MFYTPLWSLRPPGLLRDEVFGEQTSWQKHVCVLMDCSTMTFFKLGRFPSAANHQWSLLWDEVICHLQPVPPAMLWSIRNGSRLSILCFIMTNVLFRMRAEGKPAIRVKLSEPSGCPDVGSTVQLQWTLNDTWRQLVQDFISKGQSLIRYSLFNCKWTLSFHFRLFFLTLVNNCPYCSEIRFPWQLPSSIQGIYIINKPFSQSIQQPFWNFQDSCFRSSSSMLFLMPFRLDLACWWMYLL